MKYTVGWLMNNLPISILLISVAGFFSIGFSANASACPEWLNHSFRQLHSDNTINLCDSFADKPLFIVNTASHCGFTPQFKDLEVLHERYKSKGLVVIGFASNDFRQEAKNEAEAASICYENYGVRFTMIAPISVKGERAHPLFKSIAEKSQAPEWNFTKYLITANGSQVTHFKTVTSPQDSSITKAIEAILPN